MENQIGPNVRFEGGTGTDTAQWTDDNIEILSTDNHIESGVICLRAKVVNVVDAGGNNFYTSVHTFYRPIGFWSQRVASSTYKSCEADGPTDVGFKTEAHKVVVDGNRVFWPIEDPPSSCTVGVQLVYAIMGSVITDNAIPGILTERKIVSLDRVDPSTLIYGNPGAAMNTGIHTSKPKRQLSRTVRRRADD